jgi:hypothetical protein
MAIGKLARMIPTMVKGVKMMDSGSSEQEARSYMESQGLRNIQISKPMAVDVSADGMRKKSKALKGTTVSYSGIKTSSQGLLTGVKTEKKTLLGG